MNGKSLAVAIMTSALLAIGGCGDSSTPAAAPGGGGNAGGGGGGGAPAPVPSAATGALKSDQTTANELVAAVNSGVNTAYTAQNFKNADTPFGAQIKGLPLGVAQTVDCATLGSGVCTGSFTVDTNATGQNLAGTSTTITYNNVVFASIAGSFAYNGTVQITYDRYTSANDFRVTTNYSNLSVGGAAAVSGSYVCDVTPSASSCDYLVNGASVSDNITVSRSGTSTTVTRGTLRANYAGAGGYVDCVYNGWTYNSASNSATAGGTVTVNGVNGTRAVITAQANGRYTVAITVNGTTTTYNV
jgi:hypothetical protein